MVRTGEFSLPFLYVSLVVFHIEKEEDMGIGELEIGHGSLNGDCLRGVIRGRPVMCKQRDRDRQKPDRKYRNSECSGFHGTSGPGWSAQFLRKKCQLNGVKFNSVK